MKRIGLIILVLAIALGTLAAEETETSATETFITELAYQLKERGWDEEAVEMLREQARLLNWEEARFADPAMIAYALHHGTIEDGEPTKEMAKLRAQLALEVAIESREMLRLGFAEQAIAQGAARGLNDVVEQTRLQNGKTDGQPVGSMNRDMIRNAVRVAVRNEIASQQKTSARNNLDFAKQAAGKSGNFGPSGNAFSHKPGTPSGGAR